jgi:hypothetical protein
MILITRRVILDPTTDMAPGRINVRFVMLSTVLKVHMPSQEAIMQMMLVLIAMLAITGTLFLALIGNPLIIFIQKTVTLLEGERIFRIVQFGNGLKISNLKACIAANPKQYRYVILCQQN